MSTEELRRRVQILHAAINQLIAGNLTHSQTTAQERIDITVSALVSVLGEATTGLNVNPDAIVGQFREQLARLTQ